MQRHSLFLTGLLVLLPNTVSPSLSRFPVPNFPQVALTFDDGPHFKPTHHLCEILARHQVPATFFIVGRVGEKNKNVMRFLADSGHEVANHTWSHPDIRFISQSKLRRELDRTRLLIHQTTGHDTFLFRTPGSTEAYLRHHFTVPSGYHLVMWDVHSLDQEGRSSVDIASRVLSSVKDGDVILMHNGLDSTNQALETIIPTLKARGFQFVTVSKLSKYRTGT